MANKQKRCSTYAGTTGKWTRKDRTVTKPSKKTIQVKVEVDGVEVTQDQVVETKTLAHFDSNRKAKRHMRTGA